MSNHEAETQPRLCHLTETPEVRMLATEIVGRCFEGKTGSNGWSSFAKAGQDLRFKGFGFRV